MATLNTSAYLDGGTARSAGETWTINNGSILTIRTDTRVHANAPTLMTGTLGTITTSSTGGGGVYIDATAVRWLAFDNGTGNVPAIGTSITQAGVTSSYLLGVWASMTSAPTTVGSAMPATGFLKFREVTGAFDIGALTGIGASATAVDELGWIEIVGDQSMNVLCYQGAVGFKTRGGWFRVGTTTGVAGQQIQCPTNGGGAGTYICGIMIGDPATTGEWYPAVSQLSGQWYIGQIGTDQRSTMVEAMVGGIARIGHDGTGNIGFVPAAGLPIYIPNILMRQCTTAARAANVVPSTTYSTRPEITAYYGTIFDIENVMMDWSYSTTTNSPQKDFVMKHSAITDSLQIGGGSGNIELYNCCFGGITTLSTPISIGGGLSGGIEKCRVSARSSTTAVSVGYIKAEEDNPFIIRDNKFMCGLSVASPACKGLLVSNCSNVIVEANISIKGTLSISSSRNITVDDFDFSVLYVGTTSTTAMNLCTITSCINVLVNNLKLGYNGLYPNQHVYGTMFYTQSNFGNIVIRNVGSRSNIFTTSINPPEYLHNSPAQEYGVTLQRIYISNTRSNMIYGQATSKNITYLNILSKTLGTVRHQQRYQTIKGCCGSAITATAVTNICGVNYWDVYLSDTMGNLVLSMFEPLEDNIDFVALTGTAAFGINGSLLMRTVGDTATFEMPYFALGHTGFTNTAITGTYTNIANHTLQYQLDRGSGYGGTWLTLTADNLYAETNGNLFGATGFKLKIKITCSVAATTNSITSLVIETSSTLAYQTNYLYSLVPFTLGGSTTKVLTLFNLVEGSTISIYRASDYGVVASTNSCFSIFEYEYTWEQNVNVTVEVSKTGYENFNVYNVILTDESMMLPINQVEI